MFMSGGDKRNGGALLKRKKVTILTSTREGGAKGRGVGDGQEGDLEELDAAIDTFIRFPELRTKS
jgi:hypothetical protein